MTREFFNKQFSALLAAYAISNKMPDESQDVYWEMLKGIPEQQFGAGVKKCLADLKFFPTIHELGIASLPPKQVTIRERARFATIELDWQGQLKLIEETDKKPIDAKVVKLLKDFS